ncbi:MAG: hypothetical protein V7603_5680 [Micromonosporaceae bacterium]
MPIYSGQTRARIVGVEVALAAVAAAAAAGTPGAWLVAAPSAVAALALGLGRPRQRPLPAWCATALRYAFRARHLPAGAGPAALLALVDSTALAEATVLEDAGGLTTVLEVGDATSLIGGALTLPAPADLLPAPVADGPSLRLQFLVTGVPAPAARAAAGIAATSYRQLTEGWIPASCQVLLAVRACRDDPVWTDADLRRPLESTVRRIRRRLAQDGIPARTLAPGALPAALAGLAHHDPAWPVREGWTDLRAGGLHQASVLVERWPGAGSGVATMLVSRLLCLPASAVCVGLIAGPEGSQVVVRVAAPTAAGLAAARATLHRLLAAAGATGTGLLAEQVEGLGATLPLARLRWPGPAAGSAVALPPAGLMVGRNRRGEPVTVRLTGPEPTRAALFGGVRAAALLAVRALALGTRVVVQTARPGTWEVILRGVSTPVDPIALVPPGQLPGAPPPGPLAPHLLVLDLGGAPDTATVPPAPWRTTLVVRDDLAEADLDLLAHADLAILQPLSATEAALAGAALRLGESQAWLTMIQSDMIAVVSRGRVCWARLSATPIELQAIGAPERLAVARAVSG